MLHTARKHFVLEPSLVGDTMIDSFDRASPDLAGCSPGPSGWVNVDDIAGYWAPFSWIKVDTVWLERRVSRAILTYDG